MINQIYNEDCLETMNRIDDKSINLIIADFPYFEVKGDFDFIWNKKENQLFKKNEMIKLSKNEVKLFQLFIDNYNHYSNTELHALFGFSISTISYHARRLGLDNSKRNRTSIEYYVANYLDSENIIYEEQYNFDKYRYDFYLKDLNLLIEVQGDYWHANPDVYRNTELTEVQKSNVQRDVDKKKVALENSYKIVYLWEKDIKENLLNLSSYFKKNIKIN